MHKYVKVKQMSSKFPVEKKFEIVMESLISDIPIVQMYRKYGVSLAQFHRWKDKFIKSGKKGILRIFRW
jgi:transposase-like protein